MNAKEKRKAKRSQGFSLIDVMLAITILGIMMSIGHNTYKGYTARAKRPEAIIALRAIANAQESHKETTGHYAADFDELQFALDTGISASPTEIRTNHYTFVLTRPHGSLSWYVLATGNIDGDPWLDVISAESLYSAESL